MIKIFSSRHSGNNTKQKYDQLKEFKNKKRRLDADYKKLYGFYKFNKSALISEFSMRDFYAFLDKNKLFLNKHYEEYGSVIHNLDVEKKITSLIEFDESKILHNTRSYFPRNVSKMYQAIDRYNELIIYDAESETYKKILIIPDNLQGFIFLPCSRYINFSGRLFVTGGYEGRGKQSKAVWMLEDTSLVGHSNISNQEDEFDLSVIKRSSTNVVKNLNHSSLTKTGIDDSGYSISDHFYSHLDKDCIYKDSTNPNYRLIKASEMVFARAGHALLGVAPSMVMAFSGTEGNKTCEIFHFETNKWEEIANLNHYRIDPSVMVYKNFVYIFFGLEYNKDTKKYNFLSSIERLNLMNTQTSEWEFVTPKYSDPELYRSIPRSLCGLVIKGNSSSIVYLCGGQVEKNIFSNDVIEYNFESNTLNATDKKLVKPCGFLQQNFLYLFKIGVNFDINGDVHYYHSNSDTFNLHFQKI